MRGILNNLYLGDCSEYLQDQRIFLKKKRRRSASRGSKRKRIIFWSITGSARFPTGCAGRSETCIGPSTAGRNMRCWKRCPTETLIWWTVRISPIDVVVNSREDVNAAVGAFVLKTDPADYADDRSLNDALALMVADVLLEKSAAVRMAGTEIRHREGGEGRGRLLPAERQRCLPAGSGDHRLLNGWDFSYKDNRKTIKRNRTSDSAGSPVFLTLHDIF